MRREGDEIGLVAVLDQVVFRCVRLVLFGTWFGTEEALVLTLRNFPPFLSRARLCDEQYLRSPTALITSPT